VGVEHRGLHAPVSQELLDRPDVVTAHEGMGREGMAEGMAGRVLGDADLALRRGRPAGSSSRGDDGDLVLPWSSCATGSGPGRPIASPTRLRRWGPSLPGRREGGPGPPPSGGRSRARALPPSDAPRARERTRAAEEESRGLGYTFPGAGAYRYGSA
jgi:hypothetical protein